MDLIIFDVEEGDDGDLGLRCSVWLWKKGNEFVFELFEEVDCYCGWWKGSGRGCEFLFLELLYIDEEDSWYGLFCFF